MTVDERMSVFKNVLGSFLVTILFVMLVSYKGITTTSNNTKTNSRITPAGVYHHLCLDEAGLNREVFDLALKGWEKMKLKGEVSSSIVSICDFSQSSNQKRFYVIDMEGGNLLYHTLVAHGKNSGEEFPRHFSNELSSNKSSLGFYKTGEVYTGQHGLSLKLTGLEPGINDKAETRSIVIHGADYVSEEFISRHGRLGRSLGCPALPNELNDQVIQTIRDGTCLFIFYPERNYLTGSRLLK